MKAAGRTGVDSFLCHIGHILSIPRRKKVYERKRERIGGKQRDGRLCQGDTGEDLKPCTFSLLLLYLFIPCELNISSGNRGMEKKAVGAGKL